LLYFRTKKYFLLRKKQKNKTSKAYIFVCVETLYWGEKDIHD
jgi:hypothetical protein